MFHQSHHTSLKGIIGLNLQMTSPTPVSNHPVMMCLSIQKLQINVYRGGDLKEVCNVMNTLKLWAFPTEKEESL